MSATAEPPQPNPALGRLSRLVSRWSMEANLVGSDEKNIKGETTYGPLDGTFTGSWREDGTFSGGWRPNRRADETVDVPYDIGGRRLE